MNIKNIVELNKANLKNKLLDLLYFFKFKNSKKTIDNETNVRYNVNNK